MRHYTVELGATRACVPVPDRVEVEFSDVWLEWVEVESGYYQLLPRNRVTWGQRMVELHPIGPYMMAYDAETDCLFCGRRRP